MSGVTLTPQGLSSITSSNPGMKSLVSDSLEGPSVNSECYLRVAPLPVKSLFFIARDKKIVQRAGTQALFVETPRFSLRSLQRDPNHQAGSSL